VFRFVNDFSSLMDFGPYVIHLFLHVDFEDIILACVVARVIIT
jgi:hypothetical protein